MTALPIAAMINTTLIAITPRAARLVGGNVSWRPDPHRRDGEGPHHEHAAADVEQRLRRLGALLGGEGDQCGQHGAERYRTDGRPS